jgi:hypothetical protein
MKVHGAATGRRADSSPTSSFGHQRAAHAPTASGDRQRTHRQRAAVGQRVWRKEQVAGTRIKHVDISLFSEDSRAHGLLSFLAINEGSNVQNLMSFLATNGGSNVYFFPPTWLNMEPIEGV